MEEKLNRACRELALLVRNAEAVKRYEDKKDAYKRAWVELSRKTARS